MADDPPVPKFQRFERVRVVDIPHHYPELCGRTGTILWRDCNWVARILPGFPSATGWLYLVFFAPENAYRSLWESSLQSEGHFDSESAHLGTRPEFSFDIIMEDDMVWVEGTYRLPGIFWEAMVFGKIDVPELRFKRGKTYGDVPGIWFDVPRDAQLNRQYIVQALATAFQIGGWVEVAGPDSTVFR
jgi:hypothetical protein